MQEICLPEIYIADMLGIFLVLSVLVNGAWKLQKRNGEGKVLLGMLLITIVACVADAISFTVDGHPGTFYRTTAYISNFILFVSNMLIGPLWVMLISLHINDCVSKLQKVFVTSLSFFLLLLLIANFFFPLVFCISADNIYSRGPLFLDHNLIETLFLIDGVVIFLIGRAKSGGFKFFPILQFLWPVFICILIQNLYYGISTMWAGIAIGLTSIIHAMLNENIFLDKLTRLFNRYYLDRISSELKHRKRFAMMILDMNGFKEINDNYGHSQGDDALVAMADILRKAVNSIGTPVRYAGDEFVIILNTENEEVAEKFKKKIKSSLQDFNKARTKPYKLSVSIGIGIFDLEKNSIDKVLEIIDSRMYEDKKAYYESKLHDRRKR